MASSAPAQLLELAELFTTQFGPLLTAISESRQQAFERGQDRMDSEVPLVEGTPELLRRVQDVMAAVDEYCARGDLLTLARPPGLVALNEWSISELIAAVQRRGADALAGALLARGTAGRCG